MNIENDKVIFDTCKINNKRELNTKEVLERYGYPVPVDTMSFDKYGYPIHADYEFN